jgi:hypothetical protein
MLDAKLAFTFRANDSAGTSMLGDRHLNGRRISPFPPLVEPLALGAAGLGLALWIGSIAHKPIHTVGEKKPALRTPTSTETAAYGDPAFESRNPEIASNGSPIGPIPEDKAAADKAAADGLQFDQFLYQSAIREAKKGSLLFSVPPEMTVKEPETILVHIYGPDVSEKQKQEFKATGSGTTLLITPMLVTLSQPDNPGSFKIEEDPKEAGNQFIPSNSFAEWSWTVTPLKPAEVNRKLKITAYMVFNQKLPSGSPMQVQISSYTATVTVKVQPRWDRITDWLSENWEKVLKYVIPAGTGSAIILWLIAKFGGKSSKPEVKEKEKEKEPAEDDDDDDSV